jgi:hypothetical protein
MLSEELEFLLLTFLQLLCVAPSKNPLLKPYDGTVGVFVTRFGLVRVLEDGSVVSLTFTGGKLVGMDDGKIEYEDSIFSFCRKTRLYVLPHVWKAYFPDFDIPSDNRPFFSLEVDGNLSLVFVKEGYAILDKNKKEYALIFKEGIALMKVGTKLVPLFDGCRKSLEKKLKLEEKAITLSLKKEFKALDRKEKALDRKENALERKINREKKAFERQEANKESLSETLESIKALSTTYNI